LTAPEPCGRVETKERSRRNGRLRIPLPFDEAMKAALEAEPPKDVERAKKARVASRSRRQKSKKS
jgi:hypothetical protein